MATGFLTWRADVLISGQSERPGHLHRPVSVILAFFYSILTSSLRSPLVEVIQGFLESLEVCLITGWANGMKLSQLTQLGVFLLVLLVLLYGVLDVSTSNRSTSVTRLATIHVRSRRVFTKTKNRQTTHPWNCSSDISHLTICQSHRPEPKITICQVQRHRTVVGVNPARH